MGRGPRQRLPAPGLIGLSSDYTVAHDKLSDFGSSFVNGTATHHLTLYRRPSGALVFGAGTVQWPWGLDEQHDYPGPVRRSDIKQATVNLLADMGAQPATLQSGLVAATKLSTDTTPPAATITSPAAGSSVAPGTPITMSGTAGDVGGGVVGGVEVSTDGGHLASGDGDDLMGYTWTPTVSGTVTLRARATDDTVNLGTAASVTVNVGGQTCPCSIWPRYGRAGHPNEPDASATELGVKFRTDVARVDHRHPLLQEQPEHRHPRRAVCGRATGTLRARRRSRARRRADGSG